MRTREEHRSGKKLYGYFLEQDNGLKIYMAERKHRQIYCNGNKSMSEAIKSGEAGWALDVSTLALARRREVKVVVVRDKSLGIYYITPLSRYFQPGKTKMLDWTQRGGSIQRLLPIEEFVRIDYRIRI